MIDILKNVMQITDPDHISKLATESFKNFPLHMHCKDNKGRYINFNEQVLIDCGLNTFSDLQGLTDLDFPFLKESEALNIRNRDLQVIAEGISNINMGALSLPNNIMAKEISIKNPLKSKVSKKTIGILTCAFVLRENKEFYEEFSRNNNRMNFMSCTNTHINEEYQKLSNREKQCLKLYLSGKSGRETALILGLSHRTVDEYIDNLKKKLKCNRKRELLKLFNFVD